MISGLLKGSGIELNGISGSLTSGFSAESLTVRNDALEIDAKGISYLYSSAWKLWLKKEFFIEEIRVDRAQVRIIKLAEAEKNSHSTDSQLNSNADSTSSTSERHRPLGLNTIGIRSIKISQVEVTAPSFQEPIRLDRLTLDDLVFAQGTVTLKEFQIGSTFFDLTIKGFKGTRTHIAFQERIRGTLRPSLLKALRKDLNFSADWLMAGGKHAADISFLDEKARIAMSSDGSVRAEVNDLSLREYFQTEFPGTNLHVNLEIENPIQLLLGSLPTPGAGKLVLGSGHFQITPGVSAGTPSLAGQLPGSVQTPSWFTLEHLDEKGVKFTLETKLPPNWTSGLIQRFSSAVSDAATEPVQWFELRSSGHIGLQQNLSALFFKTRYEGLSSEQKLQVDQSSRYFVAGQDPVLAPARSLPKRSASRSAPTRRANGRSLPSRRPAGR